MRLKVLLPAQVLIHEEVRKVIAEAPNGFFCLLPRHIDFVAALVPGILYYTAADGSERLVAIDEGTLVKCGAEVLVSVLNGVIGDTVKTLEDTVSESFRTLDIDDRKARSALARLEVGTMKRFLDLERQIRG